MTKLQSRLFINLLIIGGLDVTTNVKMCPSPYLQLVVMISNHYEYHREKIHNLISKIVGLK
jgi:hypothetical protein